MFHWSVRIVGDVRRRLDSIRTRADRAQAARLEGWLGAVLADRSDRSPGFDLDCAQMWWNFVGFSRADIAQAQAAWERGDERFGAVGDGRARRLVAPPLPWRGPGDTRLPHT